MEETRRTRPAPGAEAAGQLACARRPLSTLCLRFPGFCRGSSHAIRGLQRVWGRWRGVTKAPPRGLGQACGGCPQVSVSVLFWLPRGRLGPAPLSPPGERSVRAVGPRRSAGAGRAAAGSGMRRVITFARPGRLRGPQIPSPSRALGLETPSLQATSLLYFAQNADTHTRCLTREDAPKRGKPDYVLPVEGGGGGGPS